MVRIIISKIIIKNATVNSSSGKTSKRIEHCAKTRMERTPRILSTLYKLMVSQILQVTHAVIWLLQFIKWIIDNKLKIVAITWTVITRMPTI